MSSLDDAYLDLLKKTLTRSIAAERSYRPIRVSRKSHPVAALVYPALAAVLDRMGLTVCRTIEFDPARRIEGRDWPLHAETMIGLKRMDNLHACIDAVMAENIPGDLIETGVWRGGACIFMRGALKAYGDENRTVWVADSFAGLPKPDGRYRQDEGDLHWTMTEAFSVSLDEVRDNFRRYGLLDERVRFLEGWFKDTLPAAPIERLAVMRLDGDMYSSTMDALTSLYPKLSPGGFVIIDDYGAIAACRRAVDDFRAERGIGDPLTTVDWTGVFWRKT